MKLITLPAIDPAHFKNLLFASRLSLQGLKSADIVNVGVSLGEIEAALEKGTLSDPPTQVAKENT